jgi:hypothetical protein
MVITGESGTTEEAGQRWPAFFMCYRRKYMAKQRVFFVAK